MRIALTCLLLCTAFIAKTQYIIEGTITNSNGETLPGANVILRGDVNVGVSADEEGFYSARLSQKPESLTFSFVGYESKTYAFSRVVKKGDRWILNAVLAADAYYLDGAVIQAAPDTIYGDEIYHVGDVAILDDGLLLLTYKKEDRLKRQELKDKCIHQGVKLVRTDFEGNYRDALTMRDKCLDFFTGHFNEVLVSTLDSIYLIQQGKQMSLAGVRQQDFDNYFVPVIDSLHSQILFSTYDEDYPGFDYYRINQKDSTFKALRSVADKEMMEQFRSEYKWLSTREKLNAKRLEIQTGIDKEIFGAYMTGFTNSIYYDALYAPLFVQNDSVLVFDHHADLLVTYTEAFDRVDSVPISYHKGRKGRFWEDQVLFDHANGSAYALFKRNGRAYLGGVDKNTGEIMGYCKLHYKYPDKIRIHNGEAYYVYRPFESSQKKFLYREEVILAAIDWL